MEIKLSSSDKKLLRCVSDIGNKGKERVTVQALADYAGISVDKVYKRLQDEAFRGLFIEAMKLSLVTEVPEILKIFVEKAKQGEFRYGKLILEIAGVYSEETKVNLNAKVDTTGSPFKSEEDKREFCETLASRFVVKKGSEEA